MKKTIVNCLIRTGSLLLLTLNVNAAEPRPETCDRACLYGFADLYYAAMLDGDVSRLPLSKHVKYSENGVVMEVGDGVWNTIDGVRGYDLKIADPQQGR